MKITAETVNKAIREFGCGNDPVALRQWFDNTGHSEEDIRELREYMEESLGVMIDTFQGNEMLYAAISAAFVTMFRCGMLYGLSLTDTPDYPEGQ